MKAKLLNVVIFISSLLCLIISIRLFWDMGVFADEYNTSASVVCGGDFWLYMDWFRLFITFIICVLSGSNLIKE